MAHDLRADATAARLNAAAAGLLRIARRDETASPLSAPRLAALAAIVDRGPLSLVALAAEIGVRAPTMTRLVDALVGAGLVTRDPDPGDRRMVRIAATDEGPALLEEGRRRRVATVAERLARLAESERRALERGIDLIEQISR
jgi:DNA-binding MarR family transcriptional regulator